jgi:hypothetical protein
MGGDRFWISPERAFFYKNPEAFKDWFCPETLDPNNITPFFFNVLIDIYDILIY